MSKLIVLVTTINWSGLRQFDIIRLGCCLIGHSSSIYSLYPIKYEHEFAALCFVLLCMILNGLMWITHAVQDSPDHCAYIQGWFDVIGRFPQCQWSIWQTVCIFIGMYCIPTQGIAVSKTRKNIYSPMYRLGLNFTVISYAYRIFVPNKTTSTKYYLTQWISKLPARPRQFSQVSGMANCPNFQHWYYVRISITSYWYAR